MSSWDIIFHQHCSLKQGGLNKSAPECQNIDCYTVQTFIRVGKALIHVHVDLRYFKKLCHVNKHSITRNAYKNKLFLRVAYLERHEMKST